MQAAEATRPFGYNLGAHDRAHPGKRPRRVKRRTSECVNEFSFPGPRRIEPMAGELVTEAFDYDGGRLVTVYVPPDPPEAIVFAGDGQMISQWGGLLEAVDVPSTMIVGAHRVADETLRLHEYSPDFDPERFAAHERFLVEDVAAWARSRFGVTLNAHRT